MSHDEVLSFIEAHNRREQSAREDAFAPWMGINCEIHPNDEIFRFFYDHPTSTNPVRDYLADGWRTLVELMVPLERIGHPLTATRAFLEFACGYGRLTRHLARFIDKAYLDACDIMPESGDFVSQKFGAKGFYSTTSSEELLLPRAYDTVFALSLFSHLPARSWQGWLARLFDALDPGGVLIFTTHGSGFAGRHGIALDNEGFFYQATSESTYLDGQTYGSTITSEAYVRRAIDRLPGSEIALFLPDHFWAGQDGWFVRKANPEDDRLLQPESKVGSDA